MKNRITYKNIIKDDNKKNLDILRAQSQEVIFPLSSEDIEIINQLQDYLDVAATSEENEFYRPGVGLAAPQIGINKKIFAIDMYDFDSNQEIQEIIINPKILSTSQDQIYLDGGEGCLSVDRELDVELTPRYRFIRLSYQDVDGNKITKKIFNYQAIVFQHEYDHLIGKMFYDTFINEAKANELGIKKYKIEIEENEENDFD